MSPAFPHRRSSCTAGVRPFGDRPVLSLPSRVAYKAWRMLRGNGIEPEATAAYVKAFKTPVGILEAG
jgi:hypothetical protein